jgi:hypothetical protein
VTSARSALRSVQSVRLHPHALRVPHVRPGALHGPTPFQPSPSPLDSDGRPLRPSVLSDTQRAWFLSPDAGFLRSHKAQQQHMRECSARTRTVRRVTLAQSRTACRDKALKRRGPTTHHTTNPDLQNRLRALLASMRADRQKGARWGPVGVPRKRDVQLAQASQRATLLEQTSARDARHAKREAVHTRVGIHRHELGTTVLIRDSLDPCGLLLTNGCVRTIFFLLVLPLTLG